MRTAFQKLMLAVTLGFITTPLYAHIRIVPAKPILTKDKKLSFVAFLQPCGSKVLGIAIDKETSNRTSLGVAVSMPQIACAGMPKAGRLSASALNFPRKVRFSSYQPPLYKTPLQFSRVHNLIYVKQEAQLQIVHHRSCHAVLSSIPVYKQDPKGISVGVLEFRMFSEKVCNHSQRTIKLPAFLTEKMTRLNTLQSQEEVVSEETSPYNLRLKNIVSMGSLESRGLHVSFNKLCNEAPVGLFVKQVTRKGQTKYLIAALAAHFPEQECKEKAQVTTINLPQMELPKKQIVVVKSAKIGSITNLVVNKPQEVEVENAVATRSAIASVQYYHDCDRHLGLVFASDKQNNLAVGILKKRESFRCTSGVQSRIWQQPLMSTSDNIKQLFPLTLEGQNSI